MPGRSMAMGFSQKTGRPARAALAIRPACEAVAEAMTTASTPQVNTSSGDGAAVAPIRCATSVARAPSVSATTSAPTSR